MTDIDWASPDELPGGFIDVHDTEAAAELYECIVRLCGSMADYMLLERMAAKLMEMPL